MSPNRKRVHRRPVAPVDHGAIADPGSGSDSDGGFRHRPVMLAEVLDVFASVPAGVVLDATVGGGGHARAILDAFPALSVLGLDQDEDALHAAGAVLAGYGDRAELARARFDRLGDVLEARPASSAPVVGALFDLGVSSPQLDRPERGFSYRFDAPLDMRMDQSAPLTAADLVNNSSQRELAVLFAEHGETRFAGRIASAVVAARPLTTTGELAEVVAGAVPAAIRRRGHPAKRVFQALRVAVNAELEVLPVAIDAALRRVVPGGRVVVIAYHSGEDRLVKERFVQAATGGCTCPDGLPCACGAVPWARLLNRGARKPTPAEVLANPRSESARLRAIEITAEPPLLAGVSGSAPEEDEERPQ